MTPDASTPTDIIAEALAAHDGHGDNAYDDFYACACGEWDTDIVSYDERKAAHVAHQASAVDARLVQAGHAIVPSGSAEARQWDGARASIESLCRWVNAEDDPMDNATLTYTFSGSGDVREVNMATTDGFRMVAPGDLIVRTAAGVFLLVREFLAAAASATKEPADPDGNHIFRGSPEKCVECGITRVQHEQDGPLYAHGPSAKDGE